MAALEKFLLSRISPDTVKSLGTILMIAGSVATAVLVAMERTFLGALSAFFTMVIVAGTWIQGVGIHAIEVAQKTPRWQLLEENAVLLTKQMKQFAGTNFDAACGSEDDREQLNLLWALESAISNAGLIQINWAWEPVWASKRNRETFQIMSEYWYGKVDVVNVVIQAAMHGRAITAADTLASVLNEIGIFTTRENADATNNNFEAIHLLVGHKT